MKSKVFPCTVVAKWALSMAHADEKTVDPSGLSKPHLVPVNAQTDLALIESIL